MSDSSWRQGQSPDDPNTFYYFWNWEYLRRSDAYRQWYEEPPTKDVKLFDPWPCYSHPPDKGMDADALLSLVLANELDSVEHPTYVCFDPTEAHQQSVQGIWFGVNDAGWLQIEVPPGIDYAAQAGAIGRHIEASLQKMSTELQCCKNGLKIGNINKHFLPFNDAVGRIRIEWLPRSIGLWLYDGLRLNEYKSSMEAIQDLQEIYKEVLTEKYSSDAGKDDKHIMKLLQGTRRCVAAGKYLSL